MWWLTVGLPLLFALAGSIAYQHWTSPYPATPYSLLPLTGRLPLNSRLQSAVVHQSSLLAGPETIAVHPIDSSLWTGCYDGSLVRAETTEAGFEARLVTYTGWAAVNATAGSHAAVNVTSVCSSSRAPWLCGRPLGLVFRSADELLIADGYHGLLSYSLSSGRWRSLWNDTARDTNSVTMDGSGGDVAYFTSASALYRNHVVLYDCVSGQCSGSVWAYHFQTRTARLLHDGLCFPNGILVQQQRLLVAETSTARLLSLSRMDDQQQQQRLSVVADSDRLPCQPDNLHYDKHSTTYYWMGCGGPIRAINAFDTYDFLGPRPMLRQLMIYVLPYKLLDSFVPAQAMVVRMRIVNDSWHELSDVRPLLTAP